MKRGTIVAVCQDGKWGRRVKGVVTDTRNGHNIKVKFTQDYGNNEPPVEIEFWARINNTIHYRRSKHGTCITYGKRYKYFSGWADVDIFCPWYSVRKWRE